MKRPGKTRRLLLAVSAAAAVCVLLSALAISLSWRAHVIALKMSGGLPQLGWTDLVHMLRPNSGYWLQPLLDSPNPYSAIRNPLRSPQDIRSGSTLFRDHCERCHGPEANGGSAPSLVGQNLAHGSSDWALFSTVRDGIPGTAMPPHAYPENDLWKLVAYIQDRAISFDAQAASESAATLGPLVVRSASLDSARSAGDDWPTYYGSYNGHRFSSLYYINQHNITQLGARWLHQLPARAARVEATPIAAGGRLFLTDPEGGVTALDAATGVLLWQYSREVPHDVMICCATANRGIALLGDKVFVETLDAHLLALSNTDGKLLWDVMIADYHDGYSSTGAPLAVKGMILVGVAGAEFGAGGFVAAHDASSGKRLWRFDTIPRPGQKGNESWAGDSWRTGGVATWMTGTYDPELDLIYWGTGNPAPDFNAAVRAGDNLYSNAVVALKADTGELAWYFQYTPGDDHDWDAVQVPVLVDIADGPQTHKLLLTANRNGFFYALDRTNGRYLRAAPFVKQTWAERIDSAGRPVRRPGAASSEQGSLVYPGVAGGTSWWPPTFDPDVQMFIVPALERPGVFFRTAHQERRRAGTQLLGGISNSTIVGHYTAVRALDPRTGTLQWEHRFGVRQQSADLCGLLSTAGGLVFTSDQDTLVALDVKDGRSLWSFQAGAHIYTPPATYLVGSEQFVAIVAGDVVIGLALPRPTT